MASSLPQDRGIGTLCDITHTQIHDLSSSPSARSFLPANVPSFEKRRNCGRAKANLCCHANLSLVVGRGAKWWVVNIYRLLTARLMCALVSSFLRLPPSLWFIRPFLFSFHLADLCLRPRRVRRNGRFLCEASLIKFLHFDPNLAFNEMKTLLCDPQERRIK